MLRRLPRLAQQPQQPLRSLSRGYASGCFGRSSNGVSRNRSRGIARARKYASNTSVAACCAGSSV